MPRYVLEAIRAGWVAAALVIAAPGTAWACAELSLGVEVGAGAEASSLGVVRPAGVVAVGAGWGLEPCLGWPLRAELALATSTRGPPWYQGVAAARVRSLQVDFTAAAGPSLPFWRSEGWTNDLELGGELLVGPGIRMVAVTTRIQQRSSTYLDTQPTARGVAGLYLRVGRLRLTVRGEWMAPFDGQGLVGLAWLL